LYQVFSFFSRGFEKYFDVCQAFFSKNFIFIEKILETGIFSPEIPV